MTGQGLRAGSWVGWRARVELTERQRNILKIVVEEYVATAVPVPSEKVARRPELKVSSATVRNDMVDMEELGLLTHPHTSAGRVPSDLGYRYYIDHLMTETEMSEAEKDMIWHQFHQVEEEIDEWGPLAAVVMARISRSASLVTNPHRPQNRMRRLELVLVRDDLALVVLILQSSQVRQRPLRLDRPGNRDELLRLAARMTALLEGKVAPEINHMIPDLIGVERDLARLVVRLMGHGQPGADGGLYYEGIDFVSAEPEFGRTERLMDLVAALRQGSALAPILSGARASDGLTVVIGAEAPSDQMRGYSFILKRYGPSDDASGVVGVVGPTRMRYWRAVGLVRFMADLLDRLVDRTLERGR
jgi:heat-inducible transcriptional repressor